MTPNSELKAPSSRSSGERALLLSLWTVLALASLIWRFWPAPDDLRMPQSIARVRLQKELGNWFGSGEVSNRNATHYVVRLSVLDAYRESIREPRTVHLGYSLRGESRVLFRGSVPCVLDGNDRAIVELPNPDRVTARDIELYLAH